MIHDKKQIIRSMKSYSEGGSSKGCGPGDGGCKSSKATRVNNRRKAWNNFKEGVDKVKGPIIGAGLATAALIANKRGLFGKEAKEALGMKKGGSVKMQKVTVKSKPMMTKKAALVKKKK